MIATVAVLAHRSTSEFSAPDDEGVFEDAALFAVQYQRGGTLIDVRRNWPLAYAKQVGRLVGIVREVRFTLLVRVGQQFGFAVLSHWSRDRLLHGPVDASFDIAVLRQDLLTEGTGGLDKGRIVQQRQCLKWRIRFLPVSDGFFT